jgi:hypothetical protein
MRGSNSNSIQITELIVAVLKQRRDELNLSQNQLLDEVKEVSPSSVLRCFQIGTSIRDSTLSPLLKVLQLTLLELLEMQELYQALMTPRQFLSDEISFNALTRSRGVNFQRSKVYIPLSLQQYQTQDLVKADTETQLLTISDLLIDVSDNLPNRIAIVAEPGTGKTTLLNHCFFEITQLSSPNLVALFNASLLTINSLYDCLYKVLPQQTLQRPLSQSEQNYLSPDQRSRIVVDFILNKHPVWILLDHLDTWNIGSENPLRILETQLNQFSPKANVILCCQLSTWDQLPNILSGFKVYTIQPLSYGELGHTNTVEQFIRAYLSESSIQATKLFQKLSNAKSSTRELYKRPLSLAWLCHCWQYNQERLPQNLFQLHQEYISICYAWLRTHCDISEEQIDQINKGLIQLALSNLSHPQSNRELYVENIQLHLPGAPTSVRSVFYFAVQAGLLHPIGVNPYNQTQSIYSFSHVTLQEYYAACGIESRFDLYDPTRNNYRIFELRWRGVVQQWLGRGDIQVLEKQELLDAIESFEDLYTNLHRYLADLLLVEAYTELSSQSTSSSILQSFIHKPSFVRIIRQSFLIEPPDRLLGVIARLTLRRVSPTILLQSLYSFKEQIPIEMFPVVDIELRRIFLDSSQPELLQLRHNILDTLNYNPLSGDEHQADIEAYELIQKIEKIAYYDSEVYNAVRRSLSRQIQSYHGMPSIEEQKRLLQPVNWYQKYSLLLTESLEIKLPESRSLTLLMSVIEQLLKAMINDEPLIQELAFIQLRRFYQRHQLCQNLVEEAIAQNAQISSILTKVRLNILKKFVDQHNHKALEKSILELASMYKQDEFLRLFIEVIQCLKEHTSELFDFLYQLIESPQTTLSLKLDAIYIHRLLCPQSQDYVSRLIELLSHEEFEISHQAGYVLIKTLNSDMVPSLIKKCKSIYSNVENISIYAQDALEKLLWESIQSISFSEFQSIWQSVND